MPRKEYNPNDNTTYVWDDSGNFVGHEKGDTQTADAAVANLGAPKQKTIPRTPSGSIDIGALTRDIASDAVPAAISALIPESHAISPAMNLMRKLGIGFGANTVADQVINAGQDKPLLNSAVDAGANTVLGVGLPEVLSAIMSGNVGFKGIKRASSTQRGNSGSSVTNSSSTTKSGPQMTPGIPYMQGPNYQFGKAAVPPEPIPGTGLSETTGTSSTAGGGTGYSNTLRDVATPGILGHLIEALKSVEYNRGNASPLMTALTGLGLNIAADATVNKKAKQ